MSEQRKRGGSASRTGLSAPVKLLGNFQKKFYFSLFSIT
ncbi:hypothetical protein LEP1GSC008_1315 [Leptospira kirschneri serovar Bulgarica str. Nikolaevo]|uniref:Uncharacterized protein n=1 Tax=Leptospira kirschneri serovar Bulgarica str. Nikolaevo TaxID=1240687 RepID=M6FG78_9LEPT|nr:hypothetical protein LEP1GSC008_1315 [Leptospira kirschneri serovar Bulgarica str. Nikolaevo]